MSGERRRVVRERRSIARKGASWLFRKVSKPHPGITPFVLDEDQARAITPPSEVADLFFGHSGRIVHKWTHYLELYDRYFQRFKGTRVRMLEIGVSEGGSLQLWRNYLGQEAVLFGVDINPDCAARADPPTQVRIGSQDDEAFLKSVVQEMGGVDLVLDDGSHHGPHIITSFRTLFPLLSDHGLYVIEDMHDDYAEWPGMRINQSLSLIKRLIDDMHRHYTGADAQESAAVGGIHLFDSIAFIEKKDEHRTGHVVVPTT
jgi:hypothetical protein